MPDISLPSTSGDLTSFAKLPGRTILFAYTWTGRPEVANPPGWDDIPGAHGSTPEAQAFRNLHTSFESLDTRIVGVSTQTSEWQREFIQRMGLPFEMVSDANLKLAKALRLPTFSIDGVTYLKRLTLAIRDGRVEYVFYPVHPPDTHARDVLAWLTDAVGYELEARLQSTQRGRP